MIPAKTRLAGTAVLLASAAVVALTSTPASATVCCEGANYFKGNGVNIHSCASSSCTVVGLGYRSQKEATVCTPNPNQNGFWHIKDLATGVTGWAADQYITELACD